MILSRRGFFGVLAGAIAAPLIVPRTSLMAMPRRPLLVLNPKLTGMVRFRGLPDPIEVIGDCVYRMCKEKHAEIGDMIITPQVGSLVYLGNDLFRSIPNLGWQVKPIEVSPRWPSDAGVKVAFP